MKTNTLFNKENLFIVLLLLFSLSINQYYGNRGIFPTDSFSHFDTGFRILLGEQPFRDYWIVSGPFVDYIQAFIFYLLGVSWQTYVFHASIINAILTILTFLIWRLDRILLDEGKIINWLKNLVNKFTWNYFSHRFSHIWLRGSSLSKKKKVWII